jgi:hypothetical protein
MADRQTLEGTIVERRCLGKKLAFATIDASATLHRVLFQRASPCWTGESTFPERPSDLEHGSVVSLDVQLNADRGAANLPVVRAWRVVSRASDAARRAGFVALATTGRLANDTCSADATAVSAVLASRDEAHRASLASRGATARVGAPTVGRRKRTLPADTATGAPPADAEWSHGGAAAKRMRATVMAAWLVETYGTALLSAARGVVDVAGGKGKLAIELSAVHRIPSTVVDPAVRKKRISSRDAKRLRKAAVAVPAHIAALFDARGAFAEEHRALLSGASCLVGMHPDQATEAIVDAALRFGTPCAVVPCCVFAGLAPERRLRGGGAVRTYDEFVQYLLEKDPRMCRATLPFEGRNVVVFRDAAAPAAAGSGAAEEGGGGAPTVRAPPAGRAAEQV